MSDFNIYEYVGCIPLSEFKNPPPDQVGCEAEKCPDCKKRMWVSNLKRKLRKEKNRKTICWYCLFNLCVKNGINPHEIELIDMLKVN